MPWIDWWIDPGNDYITCQDRCRRWLVGRSFACFVDFKFLRMRSMWPLAVAIDFGGCFCKDAKVRPGRWGR